MNGEEMLGEVMDGFRLGIVRALCVGDRYVVVDGVEVFLSV